MTNERIVSMQKYERTVKGLRGWLYSLARRRVNGTVTADDAHIYLDRQGFKKYEVFTRLSFINSVLRDGNFNPRGLTPSTRPAARRRLITEWARR